MRGYAILDENGQPLPLQETIEGTVAAVDLAPLSFETFKKGNPIQSSMEKGDNLTLENDFILYEFDQQGQLISGYDKETGKEVLDGAGNILSLYEDRPNDYDAWDVEFFYRDAIIETATISNGIPKTSGNAVKQLVFSFRIGNSTIKQLVSLHNHSKRVDFSTTVDWNEKHKMLRVHFPVNVRSDQATFDIQYGYVKRNTHRNTSWDKAKFEVVGHKYADLSEHDYGVSLLNDCKYGYMVNDNILDLNLLRSPSNPDPDADEGSHQFTYSLFPHIKDFIHSDVIAESSCLNQSPILFKDSATKAEMPIRLEGNGLELSVLKKAENEDDWILRIIETYGQHSSGFLYLRGSLIESDLMEWGKIGEKIQVDESIQLDLKPFEIRTFRYNTIVV